jgi:hypothetical protein
MREWWGDPNEELGFIRDMVEGRDTTRPFLIVFEGEPVGYIQYWFVGHHQNAQWTEGQSLAAGTAVRDHRRRSFDRPPGQAFAGHRLGGARFLRRDAARPGPPTIVIDPDPNNARAVRAYAKAGFRPVPQLEGRTGDVLIMQHDPNASRT